MMEQFLIEENLMRYRRLLREREFAPTQRQTIERLLADEEAKLQTLNKMERRP